MVDSERSGVMFTVDPATGDTSHIVIEGAFGLGEVVVGGQVEPDTYVVAKDGPDDPRRRGSAPRRSRSCAAPTVTTSASSNDAEAAARRVLTDDEVLELARARAASRAALRLAAGHRMGDRGRPHLLRAVAADHDARRPEPGAATHRPTPARSARPLVTGMGTAPGVVAGRVRVLREPERGRTCSSRARSSSRR